MCVFCVCACLYMRVNCLPLCILGCNQQHVLCGLLCFSDWVFFGWLTGGKGGKSVFLSLLLVLQAWLQCSRSRIAVLEPCLEPWYFSHQLHYTPHTHFNIAIYLKKTNKKKTNINICTYIYVYKNIYVYNI